MAGRDFFDPNFQFSPASSGERSLKFVFSGTPRGGTFFLSRLLRTLGIVAVGHEAVFTAVGMKLDNSSNYFQVDVSGFVWPYLPLSGVKVYRIVRHPVNAINSMVDYFPTFFENWETTWRKAEVYWYRAFETADPKEVLRMEDYLTWFPDVGWALNGERWDPDQLASKAFGLNKNECKNPRKSRVTWGMLSVRTQDMAKRFGYQEEK